MFNNIHVNVELIISIYFNIMNYSLSQDPFYKPQTDKSALKLTADASSQAGMRELPKPATDSSARAPRGDNLKTENSLVDANQNGEHEFATALLNLQNPIDQSSATGTPPIQNNISLQLAKDEIVALPDQWENKGQPDTQINLSEIKADSRDDNKGDNNLALTASRQSLAQRQVQSLEVETEIKARFEAPPPDDGRNVITPASQNAVSAISQLGVQQVTNNTKMSAPIQLSQILAANLISAHPPSANNNPALNTTSMTPLPEDMKLAQLRPNYETIKTGELPVREILPDMRLFQMSGAAEVASTQTASLTSVQNQSGLQMNTQLASLSNQSVPALSQVGQALAQILAGSDKPGNNNLNPILVQLSPAELGRVQIQFSFDSHERITASIVAESAETGVLLKQKSDMLLGFLKQGGFNNIDLNFEARNENNFSNFSSNGGKNQNTQPGELVSDNTAQNPINENQHPPHPATARPNMTDGRLDISL